MISWWVWWLLIGAVLSAYAYSQEAKRDYYKNMNVGPKVAAVVLIVFAWPVFLGWGIYKTL